MSKQELFDISLNHIRKQGGPSMKEECCVYKTTDGKGCGAAPFILDYAPSMEGKLWPDLCNKYPSRIDPRAVKESTFVHELQRAHDYASRHEYFLNRYEENMSALAINYGLKYALP